MWVHGTHSSFVWVRVGFLKNPKYPRFVSHSDSHSMMLSDTHQQRTGKLSTVSQSKRQWSTDANFTITPLAEVAQTGLSFPSHQPNSPIPLTKAFEASSPVSHSETFCGNIQLPNLSWRFVRSPICFFPAPQLMSKCFSQEY